MTKTQNTVRVWVKFPNDVSRLLHDRGDAFLDGAGLQTNDVFVADGFWMYVSAPKYDVNWQSGDAQTTQQVDQFLWHDLGPKHFSVGLNLYHVDDSHLTVEFTLGSPDGKSYFLSLDDIPVDKFIRESLIKEVD